MKYIWELSLQQITLVKIAEEMWNQVDIRKMIKSYIYFKSDYFNGKWQEIEDRVMKNVFHLLLHQPLKIDLLCLSRPIGRQIKAWCSNHRKEYKILKMPKQFSWTPKGTIDRKRTAEMLMKDKDIDVEARFKLACINCLENDIPELFNRIPKQQQLRFCSKLIRYWTYQIVGKIAQLCEERRLSNHYVYALKLAIDDGNPVATEFFLDKLSDEEKNTLLVECAKKTIKNMYYEKDSREFYTEIFLFILLQLNEDQQIQLLTKHPRDVLSCFLAWPYQSFFMVSAKPIMHLTSEKDHFAILKLIAFKIVEGWTDFDYRQLFRDYWRLIPRAHKDSSTRYFQMLTNLVLAGEIGIFKLLIEKASCIEMEKLILDDWAKNVCLRFGDQKKWDLLKLFVEQCAQSREVVVRLKEEFIKPDPWHAAFKHQLGEFDWETFFCLLDDLIEKKSQKTNAEKENYNPSK